MYSTSTSELWICGPDTGGDYFRDCLLVLLLRPAAGQLGTGQAAMSGPSAGTPFQAHL